MKIDPTLQSLIGEMAENINKQDNECTADPIFMVQQRNRVYGFDPDYSGDAVYVNDEGVEMSLEERDEEYSEATDRCAFDEYADFEDWCEENYTYTAYQDFWDNVQPFFTRAGAEEYIRRNGHNLSHPRIYVDSAFRNAEWQAIRQLLKTVAQAVSIPKESE